MCSVKGWNIKLLLCIYNDVIYQKTKRKERKKLKKKKGTFRSCSEIAFPVRCSLSANHSPSPSSLNEARAEEESGTLREEIKAIRTSDEGQGYVTGSQCMVTSQSRNG